jgi:hypothetical protein
VVRNPRTSSSSWLGAGDAFLLAALPRGDGVDAAPEAIAMADAERVRLGLGNVRWLESDVANPRRFPRPR